jgi:ABC-type uncharacterized transport system ATPase subunit
MHLFWQIRGVSGGERRRVSIGVDLIHDPAVLFLDEPSSGLDSTSALQVMQILSQMAVKRNRTVLLTIHQPSYRILDTINKFLVLSKGNVVYYGAVSQMETYFNNLGYTMSENVRITTSPHPTSTHSCLCLCPSNMPIMSKSIFFSKNFQRICLPSLSIMSIHEVFTPISIFYNNYIST